MQLSTLTQAHDHDSAYMLLSCCCLKAGMEAECAAANSYYCARLLVAQMCMSESVVDSGVLLHVVRKR